jgi:hypothetical protein
MSRFKSGKWPFGLLSKSSAINISLECRQSSDSVALKEKINFKVVYHHFADFVHRSMASFYLGKLPNWVFLPNERVKTMMI